MYVLMHVLQFLRYVDFNKASDWVNTVQSTVSSTRFGSEQSVHKTVLTVVFVHSVTSVRFTD